MNCPLCRAPIRIKTVLGDPGRTVTCFNDHEINIKSVLAGVMPTIPGWICWQTRSNSGISEISYAYLGERQTAAFKKYEEAGDTDEVGRYLIDNYEDWINHAYHGANIDWELDCAVPADVLRKKLATAEKSVTNAQNRVRELTESFSKYYPLDSVLPE